MCSRAKEWDQDFMGGDFTGTIRETDRPSSGQPWPPSWPVAPPKGLELLPDLDFVSEEPSMTEEEMGATLRHMDSKIAEIGDEWTSFLKLETQKRATDERKAVDEVEAWEKRQTFLNKHGAKIMGIIFTASTAGLTWFGVQIRSEIKAEQRAQTVDDSIVANKKNLDDFKLEAKEDIHTLQLDSVNQTIMIEKGFERMDKTVMKAHPRQFRDEEDLPPVDPAFTEAADAATAKKKHFDKFGTLVPDDKKPTGG